MSNISYNSCITSYLFFVVVSIKHGGEREYFEKPLQIERDHIVANLGDGGGVVAISPLRKLLPEIAPALKILDPSMHPNINMPVIQVISLAVRLCIKKAIFEKRRMQIRLI
jgi:hypothetical protein